MYNINVEILKYKRREIEKAIKIEKDKIKTVINGTKVVADIIH